MRDTSTDYVFLVMRPIKNDCDGCYCDEHWAIDSVWSDRESADVRAKRLEYGEEMFGAYVLAKFVRSLPEKLP